MTEIEVPKSEIENIRKEFLSINLKIFCVKYV